MAQFVVRKLDDDVADKLRKRARRHGRSAEEEVRQILRAAVHERATATGRLGSRISARFARAGLTEPLPELRGARVRPPDFDA